MGTPRYQRQKLTESYRFKETQKNLLSFTQRMSWAETNKQTNKQNKNKTHEKTWFMGAPGHHLQKSSRNSAHTRLSPLQQRLHYWSKYPSPSVQWKIIYYLAVNTNLDTRLRADVGIYLQSQISSDLI